jgi:hypothetical protein
MKPLKIIMVFFVFFIVGVFSVHSQDLINLKDGNVIEARIVEISQTEIRYRRYDHLDGPIIVIPATDVLSIRYENGRVEIINTVLPKPDLPFLPSAYKVDSELAVRNCQ